MFGLMERVNQFPLTNPWSIRHVPLAHMNCGMAGALEQASIPRTLPLDRERAYNSTAVDKDTPNFNTPFSPIMETASNMPQLHGLSSGDKFVQDLRADPKIPLNQHQTAINKVKFRKQCNAISTSHTH